MDTRQKLAILAEAARYDASCASSGSRRAASATGLGNTEGMGICHSYTPDGRCLSLLKLLLTNHCIYDCRYCVNRLSSDTPRARFKPAEVVELTLSFYRRNYIEGLFLSSGIVGSPDATLSELVEVARTLRVTHEFRGYIHLKVPPGADPLLIAEAGRLADRLSANVELPTQADLDLLAPAKKLAEVASTMGEIRTRIESAREERRPFAPAGQSTQMIVGATPTPDAAILTAADGLYRTQGLRRLYYSAYSPIPEADGRLPLAGPPLVREHRLYQADWLMRYYGFGVDELTTPEAPDLDLEIDPKLAWALRHRAAFPVDVNRAERELLLRVPGLGRRNVERILRIRRHHTLTTSDLARLRVSLRKVRPFLVTADQGPTAGLIDRLDLRRRVAPIQLSLFG